MGRATRMARIEDSSWNFLFCELMVEVERILNKNVS